MLLNLKKKWSGYLQLMRFNRPIGIFLLLWPTLWGLWIAASGWPSIRLLVIFIVGVIVMRAAGCVINDFADRELDRHVTRTKDRPLTTGQISSKEAFALFFVLCLAAFGLVLMTNRLTVVLSIVAIMIASIYPFMKRYTYFPQVILGAAFAWAIPMAFAAQTSYLPGYLWLIYAAVVVWTVAYDTLYAMVDRDDDMQVGIKSTAILFGQADRVIVGLLHIVMLVLLLILGHYLQLSLWYYFGLVVAVSLFIYQHYLIRYREPNACFQAFINNQWVGMSIFMGIFLHYSMN